MEFLEKAKKQFLRNQTTWLDGIAIVGFWATAAMAFRAGPIVRDILVEKNQDMRDCDPDDKEAKRTVMWETVKETVPVMAPVILAGGASTACALWSNAISSRQIATLSAAYAAVASSSREWKKKLEEIDKAKAQRVRELVSKDRNDENPPPEDDSLVEVTGRGNVLCYDEYSGRHFYSSAEAIGEAIVRLSYRIQSEMWVSLNDFYFELGIKPVKMGDDLGWNVDNTDRGRVPIYYTAVLTDDNRPCLSVQFDVEIRNREY